MSSAKWRRPLYIRFYCQKFYVSTAVCGVSGKELSASVDGEIGYAAKTSGLICFTAIETASLQLTLSLIVVMHPRFLLR